jgi:hypothetical protein
MRSFYRKSFVLVTAVAALFSANIARAESSAANVTVISIQLNKSVPNVAFIRVSAVPTGRPACATHTFWHYTLSMSDDFGRAMYATLLALYTSGGIADLGGAGVCTEFGSMESLKAVGPHT